MVEFGVCGDILIAALNKGVKDIDYISQILGMYVECPKKMYKYIQ